MSSLQVSLVDRLNSTLQDSNACGNISAFKESISRAGILASPSSFGDSLFPLGILNFRNIAAAFLLLVFAFALRIVIDKRKWEKENKALTLQHRCVEPKALKTHWFFGIDRPIQMWKAGKEGHILEFLRAIIAETGNTFTWTAFGTRIWGTQDPENVKAMFFTKEKSFSHKVRKEVLVALVGESIFTQNGAEWKHTRGLLKPSLFAPHFQNSTLFEEHVDDLIAKVRRDGAGDVEVNLSPLDDQFFCLSSPRDSTPPKQSWVWKHHHSFLGERGGKNPLCWRYAHCGKTYTAISDVEKGVAHLREVHGISSRMFRKRD